MSLIAWFEVIVQFIVSFFHGPKNVYSREDFVSWHWLTQVKANLAISEDRSWLYYNLTLTGYVGGQPVVLWQKRVSTEPALIRGFGAGSDAQIIAQVKDDLRSLATEMGKDILFCRPGQKPGSACETIKHDEPPANKRAYSLTELI